MSCTSQLTLHPNRHRNSRKLQRQKRQKKKKRTSRQETYGISEMNRKIKERHIQRNHKHQKTTQKKPKTKTTRKRHMTQEQKSRICQTCVIQLLSPNMMKKPKTPSKKRMKKPQYLMPSTPTQDKGPMGKHHCAYCQRWHEPGICPLWPGRRN